MKISLALLLALLMAVPVYAENPPLSGDDPPYNEGRHVSQSNKTAVYVSIGTVIAVGTAIILLLPKYEPEDCGLNKEKEDEEESRRWFLEVGNTSNDWRSINITFTFRFDSTLR